METVDIKQQEVISFLNSLGYEIDVKMYDKINNWYQWFQGKFKDFHSYMHYNGLTYKPKERYSLGLPKKFAEAWADLLLNEKVWVSVKDSDQKKVDELLKDNDFRKKMNQLIEKSFALGTGATVEYKNFLSKPKIKYLIAPMIFPLRSEDGEIVDCAFASHKGKGNFYVEIHQLQENGKYKITNKYFNYDKETKKIKVTPMNVLKSIIKPIVTSEEKMFQILTPNITNNIDLFSQMGLSVYANAIDQIKAADIIFDSFKNEYELGKKKVYVKTGALTFKTVDGKTVPIFDENQTEFFAIPGDEDDGKETVTESQSDLRSESLIDGLDTAINLAADASGFGHDYFSFKDGEVYTNTTQVISSNSKLYRTLKKHEIILESVIIGVVKSLMYLSTGKIYQGDITIDFDDSIIEDKDAIKRQAQMEYNAGLIDAIQYYQDVYKMTEDQATEFYTKIQERMPKVKSEEDPE